MASLALRTMSGTLWVVSGCERDTENIYIVELFPESCRCLSALLGRYGLELPRRDWRHIFYSLLAKVKLCFMCFLVPSGCQETEEMRGRG